MYLIYICIYVCMCTCFNKRKKMIFLPKISKYMHPFTKNFLHAQNFCIKSYIHSFQKYVCAYIYVHMCMHNVHTNMCKHVHTPMF